MLPAVVVPTMSESLQYREGARLSDQLEAVEEQLETVCDDLSDPIDVNQLKEAEFLVWEIRKKLEG